MKKFREKEFAKGSENDEAFCEKICFSNKCEIFKKQKEILAIYCEIFAFFFSFAKEITVEFRGKSKNFRFPHFAGNPRGNPLKCF